MIMVTNSELIMKGDSLMNHVTQLWTKINLSSILKHKFLEFIKLIEIACVQILGTMEDEHCFSTMAFMKNKSRNHLTCHLDLCTRFYAQKFYNLLRISLMKRPWRSGRTQNHDIVFMFKGKWHFS
jgi:hypothetical protein